MKKVSDEAKAKESNARATVKAEKEMNKKSRAVAKEAVKKAGAANDKKIDEEGDAKEASSKKEYSAEVSSNFLDFMVRPLVSEKAVDMVEKENKITFIVKKEVSKAEIKKIFEGEFKVKVDKINVINDMKGQKKAIIKINKNYKASDIAMKLGLL